MNQTIKLFALAQLAEASYGDFTINNDKKALTDYSFSDKQADYFLANWQVVHHQPDTASGYSGTLFKYIGNDPNGGFTNGELVFAQRGTKGPFDIIETDVHEVATNGLAFRQIVDMYNYWQRLTATSGATVHEAHLVLADSTTPNDKVILESFALTLPPVRWTIEFTDVTNAGLGKATLSDLSDTTGHSLGGHLAVAFTRLFGSEATTINGAGFATGLLPGLGLTAGNNIPNLFSMLNGANNFVKANNDNLFGIKNPEIITQDGPGLYQQAVHTGLFIEQNSFAGNLFGHGGAQMTDSLAVANLFIRLDASLATQTPAGALSTLNALFEKSSNIAAQSLEKLAEGLSQTILGTKPELTTAATLDKREPLYLAIKALTDNPTFQALIGHVTIVAPPTSASEARSDLGLFLSLYYLTPFALKTDGSIAADAQLTIANPDIATQFKDDKLLTPEQIANGEANFSDLWLADRAAMLSWQNRINAEDFVDSGLGYLGVAGAASQHFEDKASATIIDINKLGPNKRNFIFGASTGDNPNDTLSGGTKNDHLYGMGGNDSINGGDGNDYIEGNAGQDTLKGEAGNDTLIGGSDVDILDGGTGNDQLKGGEGVDVYQFTGSYGTDIITDSDGQGVIKIDNNPQLNGGKQIAHNVYYNEATKYTYTLAGTVGDQTLVIRKDGDSNQIIVQHWSASKNLNITLDDNVTATPAPQAILYAGASYTNLISKCLPQASAYLRKVATDGDCLSLAIELSKREIAGGLVPIRAAICAWVKPEASLASSKASNNANSSRSNRSTSALNAGSVIHAATMASCDLVGAWRAALILDLIIFKLLFVLSSNIQLARRGGLSLFSKTMQHHNTLIDHYAIKYTRNAFSAFNPQLKQTITHRPRVWHTKVSAMLLHSKYITSVLSSNSQRQLIHRKSHRFTEIFDSKHGEILTDMLTNSNSRNAKVQAANDDAFIISQAA